MQKKPYLLSPLLEICRQSVEDLQKILCVLQSGENLVKRWSYDENLGLERGSSPYQWTRSTRGNHSTMTVWGGGGFSKNMGHMREGAGGGCRNKSTFERVVLSWGAQVPGENHTSEIVTRYWLTPRWGFA